MLLAWSLLAGLLLTIPYLEGVKSAGNIHISDEEILETFLEAQQKILCDSENIRSDESRHPQIKTELRPEQQHAHILEMTTIKLFNTMGLKTKQEREQLRDIGSKIIRHLKPKDKDVPQCNSKSRYPNIDGTCYNLDNPVLGAANTAFIRLRGAGAEYADGISKPRQAQNGSDLPNARRVSFEVFTNEDKPSANMSHMAMTWGQYVDHDITLAAQPAITCQGACNNLSRECFGIQIPADDPHFLQVNVSCIALKRDAPAAAAGLGTPRQHTNVLTAFIDASLVYGVDMISLGQLRDTVKGQGLMREIPHPGSSALHGLLPPATSGFCRSKLPITQPCFKAGDKRANVNPGLTAIHVLAVREHNRIAKELGAMNQHWDGEKIFQETRKIVAAQHQHITYNEYLPEILDQSYIDHYGLKLKNNRFYTGYNSSVNPSISSSFSAAAFRFGHSQIQDMMSRYGVKYANKYAPFPTKEYFNPAAMYGVSHGGIDGLIRGLVKDHSQQVDGSFGKAVQHQLIRGPGDVSDLAAINIQRGRERGLPGYNTFRSLCGLKTATSFDQFKTEIPSAVVDKMAAIYKHPDDVDLFVGGILESHVGAGALGPTFSCLIAEQFQRLRIGDRFWYENKSTVGFSRVQLNELRKVSLARMLCDNSDNIKEIPLKVLSVNSAQVACDSLPKMDLTKWKAAN